MRIYDIGGRFYDLIHFASSFGRVERLKREAIASLGIQPGDTVLDWGCGTGLSAKWLLRELQSRGTIYEVDYSPGMMKQAVARARPSRELEYHFILRQGVKLDLPTPVRAVVASYALGVLKPDELHEALRGIWRNVVPGGKLLVIDMYAPPCQSWLGRVCQRLTMTFEHAVFRQDFQHPVLPAVERYFRPLEVRYHPGDMAVTYVGERLDAPHDPRVKATGVPATPPA